MIILKPHYSDMCVVTLGSSVHTVMRALEKKHWDDVLDYPQSYSDDHVNEVKEFLKKEFDSVDEIMDFYNETMDEDYIMEESR